MDPNIELALAKRSDAGTIAQMSRDLVEAGLDWSWKPARVLAMIQHPDCVVLIARSRFGIAGFALMEFHDVHAHLNLLAVKPAQRRSGVGKAMMVWLEESARVAGIANIRLELRADNTGALGFYQSLGFVNEKVLKGYYQGKVNALTMVRHLMNPEVAAQRP